MKRENHLYILLILSIIFIPAAYLYAALDFIIQICRGNFNPIKQIKHNSNLLIMFLYIVAGVFFSHYKLISSLYAFLMLLCLYSISIYIINMRYVNDDKINRLIYIVSLIVFFIGIIQYLNPEFVMPNKWVDRDEYELNKRIYSTFFNPNVFGFYINFVLIILCGNISTKKISKIELLTFLVGVICLFLTFSRTSWISLLIALILSGIFFNKKYFVFALIIGFFLFGLDEIFNIGRLNPAKVAEDSSILYRIEIWKSCIKIIKDNMITGIGFGTLFKYIPQYSTVVKTNIEHCHNIYIQIAIEVGIIGVSGALFVFYNLIKSLINKLNKRNSNQRWITVFSIIIMVMIHGLIDSVLFTPQIMMILSIYTGIVMGKERIACISYVR